ncbi:MAG: four helix bundle protein [Ferruginibacter sp.]
MQNNKKNLIVELSFNFAVKSVKYAEKLETERRYVIARQFLRSSTGIGASIREAQNAESKTDFIHKMKIAAKEADETEYWLMICKEARYADCEELLADCGIISKVLSKIISSSKSK